MSKKNECMGMDGGGRSSPDDLKPKVLLSKDKETETESDDVKVSAEHPGILNVPDGKFLSTGADHYIKLAKSMGSSGHEKVSRALVNLARWNKGKGGEKDKIANQAQSMIGALHTAFDKSKDKQPKPEKPTVKKPEKPAEESISPLEQTDRLLQEMINLIS